MGRSRRPRRATAPFGRSCRGTGESAAVADEGGTRDRVVSEHAGGDEALHPLEERFYAQALADPVLQRLFPEEFRPTSTI
jgi:hypothetical protein